MGKLLSGLDPDGRKCERHIPESENLREGPPRTPGRKKLPMELEYKAAHTQYSVFNPQSFPFGEAKHS